MSETEFTAFFARVFANLATASADGAINYVCMDWRHMGEVLAAARGTYTELKNLCVWSKTNGGMGSLYRSQHEFVFVFKAGTSFLLALPIHAAREERATIGAPHINNVEFGKHGRYRTNVSCRRQARHDPYAGANAFGDTRKGDLAMHPTVKPVALVADAILDCSAPKGIVLDAFAGSGTTLVAAHKTRRRGFGIELDPHYCDVILARLKTATRLEPVLAGSGATFAEVSAARNAETAPAATEEAAA
jgi:hypothetical protein